MCSLIGGFRRMIIFKWLPMSLCQPAVTRAFVFVPNPTLLNLTFKFPQLYKRSADSWKDWIPVVSYPKVSTESVPSDCRDWDWRERERERGKEGDCDPEWKCTERDTDWMSKDKWWPGRGREIERALAEGTKKIKVQILDLVFFLRGENGREGCGIEEGGRKQRGA